MIIKSFIFLCIYAINLLAEGSRHELSLLLEYERELKKINDSLEENDGNPFVKQRKILQKTPQTSSSAIQVSKERTQESTKVASIPAPETKDNPFLIIKKPEKDNQTDEAPKLPLSAKSLVSNFKNAKDRLLSRAKDFLGTPYGFGSKEGMRTDCSGFTQQVYKQFGVNLPRSAAEQSQLGVRVSMDDLEVGDLLFYRTYKSDPSHVAIYAGNGQIIHASFVAQKVQYDSIDKSYYKQHFLFAKRLTIKDVD